MSSRAFGLGSRFRVWGSVEPYIFLHYCVGPKLSLGFLAIPVEALDMLSFHFLSMLNCTIDLNRICRVSVKGWVIPPYSNSYHKNRS